MKNVFVILLFLILIFKNLSAQEIHEVTFLDGSIQKFVILSETQKSFRAISNEHYTTPEDTQFVVYLQKKYIKLIDGLPQEFPGHIDERKHKLTDSSQRFYGLGFGYSGNFPKQKLGLNLVKLTNNNMGFYFELKGNPWAIPSDQEYYKNIDLYEAESIFNDEFLGEKEVWLSFNLGIIQFVYKSTAVYFGTGLTYRDVFRQYYDHFHILGIHGKYYIEGESSSFVNLNGGLFFYMEPDQETKGYFAIGVNSKPKGINLSIGVIF